MDHQKTIGATFREVGKGDRAGKPTRTVRASRTYPSDVNDLWDALTKKERLQRWFGEVSGELKTGGRFSIKGNAQGAILTCDPPKHLMFTWEFGDNVSWVNVYLSDSNDGTKLTLEHEMPTDEASEAHWQKYGPGATGVGWELAIFSLDRHFSDELHTPQKTEEEWATSAQGKTSLRAWAQAWGEVHIKSGASRQSAQDAADNTAGFYTGE